MILALIIIISTSEIRNPAIDINEYMTIAVINIYGNYLSLSLNFNAGALTLVDNPSPITLSDYIFTQFAFPTGWVGRVYMV